MILLPHLFLFFFLLGFSVFYVMSSEMLFSMWMGLEINMMAFILIMFSMANVRQNESIIKYFLVQVFGSLMFLSSTLMLMLLLSMNIESMVHNLWNFCIFIAIWLKVGGAPTHFWVPGVMEGLSWVSGGLLLTWQKLAPLFIFSCIFMTVNLNLIFALCVFSSLFGDIAGLNQMSLRKILAYSSINHLGWLFLALTYSDFIWKVYFMFYSFFAFGLIVVFLMMNWHFVSQMFLSKSSYLVTLLVFFLLISLGGLPPFAGFVMKWVVLKNLILNNMIIPSVLLVMGSIITLYYYFRLLFMILLNSPLLDTWYSYVQVPAFMVNFFMISIFLLPVIFSLMMLQ